MGRVEDIAAQTAKDLFADDDGTKAAEGGQTQRQCRRQAEGQEQAGQKGAAVTNGERTPHELLTERFADDGREAAGKDHAEGRPAGKVNCGGQSRQQRQQNVAHGGADGTAAVDIRRRRDDN